MSLTFYTVPNTTATVIAFVLDELEYGLPNPLAKRIELSIQAGDTKTPHYLSTVNPNGRVPAIVHEGVPIWESAAITMYLGETFGVGNANKQALYPALGPQRGEAMKWIVWTNTTLAEAAGRLAASFSLGAPGAVEEGSQDVVPKDEKSSWEAEKARRDVVKGLEILDGGLRGRDFLLGEDYCLADTHVWGFVSWITMMAVGLEDHANVKAWMARVGGRPAIKLVRAKG